MTSRAFRGAALVAAALLIPACAPDTPAGGDGALESVSERASYGIGLQLGQQLRGQLDPAQDRLDGDAFLQGFEDALNEREPSVDRETLQAALRTFGEEITQARTAAREEEATANTAEGEAYLAANAEKEGVVTTESGMQYEVLEEGDGPRPTEEDRVRVHYHGTFPDGTVFDSSVEGGEPADFAVTGVIAGFTEALLLMPVGSKYRIVIPGDLAYGPPGRGEIGPNQTLIFELELLEIL